MFGGQPVSGSSEDANNYAAAFLKQGPPPANHQMHHAPRYPPPAPCGPQDAGQGHCEYDNLNHHFYSHPPTYRSRGHPRMPPWMRPPRFANPNVNGYGDAYGPRGFHGSGRGMYRAAMRDPRDSHHFGQHYSSYRNGRRHGRQAHLQSQNYNVPLTCYQNERPPPHHEEYVPFAFSPNMHNRSYSPSNLQYLAQASPGPAPVPYIPCQQSAYNSPSSSAKKMERNTDDMQGGISSEVQMLPCNPENVTMTTDSVATSDVIVSMESGSGVVLEPINQSHSPAAGSAASTAGNQSRRNSMDSSDESASSLCLASESSSDGFDNEDSGVSTFEPSEEEERMVTRENCLTLKDESESGDLDIVPTCSYLFDDQGFVLVYIEAKSAHIIDGKGNTSTDEISCYGVWFGQGNPKNIVDEVGVRYNQERGKTGYILGVIRALSVVKEAGTYHRVHLVMGSSFVMNNLSTWVKNLKNKGSGYTNWTEWKHLKEINELLETIDGMVMKFSLAHPRDEIFVQCRDAVALQWEGMKRKRVLETSNAAHTVWPVPMVTDEQYFTA